MPVPQAGILISVAYWRPSLYAARRRDGTHNRGSFEGFRRAVTCARALNARAIWQQSVDDRGRVLAIRFDYLTYTAEPLEHRPTTVANDVEKATDGGLIVT